MIELNKVYQGDCMELIKQMEDNFINKVITSPPYNINRNYSGYNDNLSREAFIDWQVELINELDRVIKPNGSILYNFSYGVDDPLLPYSLVESISKNTKFTIVDTIVWKKPNCQPLAIYNRLSRLVEYIYVIVRKDEVDTFTTNKKEFLDKNGRKYYEVMRNYIEAAASDGIDYAYNESVYSTELIIKLLKIYCKKNEVVYDPFSGIGTTARACLIYGCEWIGSEQDWRQRNYFTNKRLVAIQRKLPELKTLYNDIMGLDFLDK